MKELYMSNADIERVDALVIGGGQAGLSVGYHFARRGVAFAILDANQRVGDSWRHRWDSLRLFTPARYDGLDGMPFPAPPHYFPTKDEMADYLEDYAREFQLSVRSGMTVDRLTKANGRFLVQAGARRFEADNVVVAMSSWQKSRLPSLAGELSPDIRQLHSGDYRNPGQLQTGDVLVVGAGNSGAEIALDVKEGRRVLLSGEAGHVPFRVDSRVGRLLGPVVLRFIFHRVLTTSTTMGRRARPKKLAHGEPLVRTKPEDLRAAGVERVARMVGARDGLPLLADGSVVQVANVIWATGFDPGFSWIDLPVLDRGNPVHDRGIASSVPGLYFVGLKFLYAMSSAQIHGVGRDAARIADAVAARHLTEPDVVGSDSLDLEANRR